MNNIEIQKHKIQILDLQEVMLQDKIKRLQDQIVKIRTKKAKLSENILRLQNSEVLKSNSFNKAT